MELFDKDDYCDKRLIALRNERQTFIPHYQEISKFIKPRAGRYFTSDRNKGDKRYQEIINSRASQAHKIARAGMVAGAVSPARPFFALATPDPDLMEFAPVKQWLYQVELLIRAILNQSNFYNMAPTLFGELLAFGTAAMVHVDDFEDVARFYSFTAGSYMIAQDHRLNVNTLARELEMSTNQMAGQFGLKNVSHHVRNAYDRGDYDQWFPVAQLIEPNENYREDKKNAKYKRFRSTYWQPGERLDGNKLSIKGYDEFPAYCPRWETTGEDIYGTDCPGMTALGDVKGLQIGERRKAQAVDQMVRPTLGGPASLANKPLPYVPGGFIAYDGGTQKLEPIHRIDPKVQELRADLKEIEMRINEAFYADMFLAISNMQGVQPKNQMELAARNEERLLQLGPVLERVHGEFLNRLIDRIFNQAVRADLLPPAPQELQEKPLKVEYISTLAQAQRAVATGSLERLVAFITGLADMGATGALRKFDAEQAVDEYAATVGVPPRVILPDDVVEKMKAEDARQQQMQQAAQMAQVAGNTTKMLADANTEGENALTNLSAAVNGEQQ